MLAIPLPFVVSLLLLLLAVILWVKPDSDTRPASGFTTLCALTTAIVGLRWSFDIALLRLLQPILASLVPMTAWYCFRRAHQAGQLSRLHWLGPAVVTLGSLSYPYWHPPLDLFLSLLYVGYGLLLLRASNADAARVRLSDMEHVGYAERIAGGLLLFSAVIDGTLTLDFAVYAGQHAMYILAVGYSVLLPTLAVCVILVSRSTLSSNSSHQPDAVPCAVPVCPKQDHDKKSVKQDSVNEDSHPLNTQSTEAPITATTSSQPMTAADAHTTVKKLDQLMQEQQVYLDPDLTLDRLARKLVIPAKQVSAAVNQIHGRNISKYINEYRIEHAKQRLLSHEESITQVYLSSGFQTKSNFNREFNRVTGQTPSAFRQHKQTG